MAADWIGRLVDKEDKQAPDLEDDGRLVFALPDIQDDEVALSCLEHCAITPGYRLQETDLDTNNTSMGLNQDEKKNVVPRGDFSHI